MAHFWELDVQSPADLAPLHDALLEDGAVLWAKRLKWLMDHRRWPKNQEEGNGYRWGWWVSDKEPGYESSRGYEDVIVVTIPYKHWFNSCTPYAAFISLISSPLLEVEDVL